MSFEPSAIVVTGAAVSFDKVAVGVSLSIVEVAFAPLLVYLAVQSFLLTLLGLVLGKRLGSRLGDAAHALAGAVFVLLGLFIIIQTARNRGVF